MTAGERVEAIKKAYTDRGQRVTHTQAILIAISIREEMPLHIGTSSADAAVCLRAERLIEHGMPATQALEQARDELTSFVPGTKRSPQTKKKRKRSPNALLKCPRGHGKKKVVKEEAGVTYLVCGCHRVMT